MIFDVICPGCGKPLVAHNAYLTCEETGCSHESDSFLMRMEVITDDDEVLKVLVRPSVEGG